MAAFPEIPGYELKKFLGSGGAADVFLAVERRRSRLVAVKVLARVKHWLWCEIHKLPGRTRLVPRPARDPEQAPGHAANHDKIKQKQ